LTSRSDFLAFITVLHGADDLARFQSQRFTFRESTAQFGYVEEISSNVTNELREAHVLQNTSHHSET